MRIFLDACVLYPTVMREIMLGVARAGVFEPQFSARVLEEWARATQKLGDEAESYARGEIALMRAQWPKAEVQSTPALEARLYLPDPHDVHVLGAAIAGSADAIMTLNAKDFPRHILAEEGLVRLDPDGYLLQVFHAQPDVLRDVAEKICTQARQMSAEAWTLRALLKKARLPRTAKALDLGRALPE